MAEKLPGKPDPYDPKTEGDYNWWFNVHTRQWVGTPKAKPEVPPITVVRVSQCYEVVLGGPEPIIRRIKQI